jgi:hypothetical protein
MVNSGLAAALPFARRANPGAFVRSREALSRTGAFAGPEDGLGVVVVVTVGVRGVFRPGIERPHNRG